MGNRDENKGVEIKLSCFLVFARWATVVRTATLQYCSLNFSGSSYLTSLYLSLPPSKLSFSQPCPKITFIYKTLPY